MSSLRAVGRPRAPSEFPSNKHWPIEHSSCFLLTKLPSVPLCCVQGADRRAGMVKLHRGVLAEAEQGAEGLCRGVRGSGLVAALSAGFLQ